MNIPNDSGHPWRLHKFVEYQHKVPPIHPIVICEYAKRKRLGADKCIHLAWLTSVTYSEITTLFLFEKMVTPIDKFWEENKKTLIFGSARKHVKNADWFVPLLNDFLDMTGDDPVKWLESLVKDNPVSTYENILQTVKSIRYTGRFAGDLFMEMLVAFSKTGQLNVELQEPEVLDWKHCNNLTSGLFNIMYMDEEADLFDKTGKIADEHMPILQNGIRDVQKAIQSRYPEQDASLPLVIGKICSFRNLFKSARYGGFHHDRQLESIIKYQKNYPEKVKLWYEIYDIRSHMFDAELLGEMGGWGGVRKERKKLWVEQGLTGVEDVTESATKGLLDAMGPKTKSDELTVTIKLNVPKEFRDVLEKALKNVQFSIGVTNNEEGNQIQLEPKEEVQPKVPNVTPNVEEQKASLPETDDPLTSVLLDYGLRPARGITQQPAPLLSSVDNKEIEQEDEEVRNPIRLTGTKARSMVVTPYDYTSQARVDKSYPTKIRKAWNKGEIDYCYFPVEPFHYRETKRHATELAVGACLENNIPFSMETRRVVPDWCIDALTRNKNSEIRIQLNTLDETKWRTLHPSASKPKELLDSFIKCFSSGAYTILRIAPIIPVIIEPVDVFKVVDAIKNWSDTVEVSFASMTDDEFKSLKEQLGDDMFTKVNEYYHKIEDRWFVLDSYRKEFLEKLSSFASGWKIKLKILTEVIIGEDDQVTRMSIGGEG
ncbi:hypothetical protein D3C74_51170 [compost metagenome]